MVRTTAESVEILKSINYVDSALFGLHIDIFKVRLLVNCFWSPGLARLGLSQNADLYFDFRHVHSFLFSVHKGVLGPPYLDDGDLSAITLADFDIGELDVRHVGKFTPCGEDMQVDEYEVFFPFRRNGSLKFRFGDLRVGTFDPEKVDDAPPDFR